MKKWDIYLGSILCIYIILINIWGGKIAFSAPVFLLGIILIVFHYSKDKIYKNEKNFKYFRLFKIFLLIGLFCWTLILGTIAFYPKTNTTKVNYAIVLGAGVRGEALSLTLKQRLNKAIEYFTQYDKECTIVLSGGQGEGEDITEAEAMRRYLVEKGIDEKRIIKEDKSTNTFQNLMYSKEIIEVDSGQVVSKLKVKVITSDFHAFRSSILASRQGYDNVTFYTNFTFPTLIPVTYARETFAVIKSYIFDK